VEYRVQRVTVYTSTSALNFSSVRDLLVFTFPTMPKLNPPLSIGESDPELLRKLAIVKRLCFLAVAGIGVFTLLCWYLPVLDKFLPNSWRLMTAETALGVLLSAYSLEFSERRYSLRVKRLSRLLAVLAALLGTAILCEYAFHIAAGLERLFPFDPNSTSPWPDRPSPQTASVLVLLGITIALIRVRRRIAVRIADLVTICLGLLVLVLASGEIFGAFRIFGLSGVTRTSPQTLFCFVLLTLVAFLRRAEKGIFSIFLGRGIGSRIARVLCPVILVLPFLREIARQRMLRSQIFSEHYATAILASVAAAMSFVFLMILVWYIKSMEAEIHNLSLRDELTGLYNLRGFKILAEQALRLAQRSQAPFSVLFVDLDNLKQVNDIHGHGVGSATLRETAELLQETFRETDVIGRVGGDEFAIAGQFSDFSVAVAVRRLRDASAQRNSAAGHEVALSFSIGQVTSTLTVHESLDALLAKADRSMYEDKRRKKSGPAEALVQSHE
jgi:diguanylate cyclase (GGDEF)-like protein